MIYLFIIIYAIILYLLVDSDMNYGIPTPLNLFEDMFFALVFTGIIIEIIYLWK